MCKRALRYLLVLISPVGMVHACHIWILYTTRLQNERNCLHFSDACPCALSSCVMYTWRKVCHISEGFILTDLFYLVSGKTSSNAVWIILRFHPDESLFHCQNGCLLACQIVPTISINSLYWCEKMASWNFLWFNHQRVPSGQAILSIYEAHIWTQ